MLYRNYVDYYALDELFSLQMIRRFVFVILHSICNGNSQRGSVRLEIFQTFFKYFIVESKNNHALQIRGEITKVE